MRLAGVPVKEIMQELNIKNKTQVQTWIRWHKAGNTGDKQDAAFVLDTLNQLQHCLRNACYIVTKVLCIHLTSIRKLLKQKALP
ncbi:transposase-like protein [Bacillus atrophaeus UCMB-5137]|nr:transposase-like protein [Bacillus atrophaeus UCMB-5137]